MHSPIHPMGFVLPLTEDISISLATLRGFRVPGAWFCFQGAERVRLKQVACTCAPCCRSRYRCSPLQVKEMATKGDARLVTERRDGLVELHVIVDGLKCTADPCPIDKLNRTFAEAVSADLLPDLGATHALLLTTDPTYLWEELEAVGDAALLRLELYERDGINYEADFAHADGTLETLLGSVENPFFVVGSLQVDLRSGAEVVGRRSVKVRPAAKRPKPRSREEAAHLRAENTRISVLGAARRHLRRDGLDVSVTQIAVDAGVSERSVYNHFSNHEQLALAVLSSDLAAAEAYAQEERFDLRRSMGLLLDVVWLDRRLVNSLAGSSTFDCLAHEIRRDLDRHGIVSGPSAIESEKILAGLMMSFAVGSGTNRDSMVELCAGYATEQSLL
jgi:AcrR family transcriptional regulator